MHRGNYKVSIITVVYNGADTIEKTIQSVLQQSYPNIEYIIIDGLSTDGTQQIIDKYVQGISYFVSEKDDGLYFAMNKGIRRATGDIIGIINSDDWYAENIIEDVVHYFEKSEAELVYGKTVIVSENGEEKEKRPVPLENIWYEIPMMHASVFVKKNIYDRYGYFDVNYKLAADCELLRRFYSVGVKFSFIDKAIAYFRLGGLSTIQSKEAYAEEYKSAMIYLDKSPCRQQALRKINERYFFEEIKNTKGLLFELLCKYFHKKDLSRIVIFGTGVWGNICFKQLKNNGVEIEYFADNDKSKWNTEFHGISVIDPNRMRNVDVYVLVAVKENGEEIKEQLADMGNDKLKCVSLKDLEKLFRK